MTTIDHLGAADSQAKWHSGSLLGSGPSSKRPCPDGVDNQTGELLDQVQLSGYPTWQTRRSTLEGIGMVGAQEILDLITCEEEDATITHGEDMAGTGHEIREEEDGEGVDGNDQLLGVEGGMCCDPVREDFLVVGFRQQTVSVIWPCASE